MTSILVAGYQAAELGIFQDKDPKLAIIKKAIRKDLERLLDSGTEWLIFRGNLGFEYWVLEEAKKLIAEGYELSLATVFCFANHGVNWNEANQIKLAQFKQVDFVKSCFEAYDSPSQLRQYQEFLLNNTQEAYLFYEPDFPTKLSYLYKAILDREDYDLTRLTYDRLNDLAQDLD